jgi:hypothetical protein
MGACLISQEKGDTRYGGVSHIWGKGRHVIWGCVTLLPNSTEKNCQQNILHAVLLEPAGMTCPLAQVCQRAQCVSGTMRA